MPFGVDPESEISNVEIATEIANTGLFKEKTQYILIGDEPNKNQMSGVLSLRSILTPDDVISIKKFMTFMPRQILFDWFYKKVWPDIPELVPGSMFISTFSEAGKMYGLPHMKKQFEDLVWAGFIDLFNEANLEYCNSNKIEPWDWEAQKYEAYTISQNKDAMAAIESEFDAYGDVALALDPNAKAIMEQYIALPKIGDPGLEINRQNSVKQLLKMKEYDSAQAIIDAFRYAADTVIGETITQPIPFDIVAKDGSAVVRKTV